MTRARILADYVSSGDELALKAPLLSPALVTPNLGTPSAGVMTNMTGGVTASLVDNAVTLAKMAGGTDGNLITYDTSGDPAYVATGTSGHVLTSAGADAVPTFQAAGGGGIIIKTTNHSSSQILEASGDETVVEADAYDMHVTCTIGNKLHIWITGGFGYGISGANWFHFGLRITDDGGTDVRTGTLYNRGTDLHNDTVPTVMYTHTAVTTSVIIRRLLRTQTPCVAKWLILEAPVRYLVMEEEV
jgi:hypothetical protein